MGRVHLAELDAEALRRVYKGEETTALKEARDIISQSFKKLNELFTPKKKRKTHRPRGVVHT